MVCPYLWQGKIISGCVAYPEGLGEEKNHCTSSDYKCCSYYLKVEERESALAKSGKGGDVFRDLVASIYKDRKNNW